MEIAQKELNLEVFKNIFEKRIPFNQFLGIALLEIGWGFAKIKIPYREEFIGEVRENRLHGGVLMAAMDSTAGAASFSTIDFIHDKIATIDLRIDFLNPANPEDVIIEAKVRKSGARVVFVNILAYHLSAPETIISEGRATFSVKRASK
jgi:uncharacterized protein (TIGR00369 family)